MSLPPSKSLYPSAALLFFSLVTIATPALYALLPRAAEAQFGPAPVILATAERRVLAPVAWYPGTVIPRNQARISTEVAGRVEHIVDVGTMVDKGDEVARIDDTLLRQSLIEDEAAVARERARLNYQDAEVRRLERLLAGNSESRSRLDAAISEREVGRSELRAAKARLDTTLERLERHRIRAPFAGTITERMRHIGEWAQSGQAVMHIVDTASLEVQAWAPLSALAFVGEDSELQVKSPAVEFLSRVRAIVPVTEEERSGIYDLRLALETPGLETGQSVRVAIPTSLAREVVAVPRDALVVRRDGTAVFRIGEDNLAERVAVVTGIADGDLIEVDEVAAGDRVVIRGGERLKPGQAVDVIDSGDEEERRDDSEKPPS